MPVPGPRAVVDPLASLPASVLAMVERLAGLAGIVLLGVAVDRLIAGRTVEVAVDRRSDMDARCY
jgi:hypothetical protein